MRSILAAALLLSVAVPPSRAEVQRGLRAPAPDEMASLAANCPGSRIIPAGTVAAYGEIYEAPLLVTSGEGRILIDGVQVVPRPLTDVNFQAQKIAERLHERFYLDEKSKDAGASARLEKRLDELKADRIIDDYQAWKRHGKLAAFLVKAGGGQARAYLDALPPPLVRRYQFLLSALFLAYLEKAESGGKERAQPWLKARLEELKAAGKIDRLGWEPERETAKIRFAGESAARDYSFGEDKSPFGVAYANRWKARRGAIESAARGIAGRLEAGGVLLYSFSFEAALPSDPAAVRALEAVREGRAPASSLADVRGRLKLTEEQARALAEELK